MAAANDDRAASPSADSEEASNSDPPANAPPNRSSSGGIDDWVTALHDVAPYLDLGWRLATITAGPPLLGYFLVDTPFGTTPWGLLGGCVLGLGAAGVQLKRLQEDFK